MAFYCLHQKKKKKMKREEISFYLKEILMKGHKAMRKVNEKQNFCYKFFQVTMQVDFPGT